MTPERKETWEVRVISLCIPAPRAEVGPETRLRAWGSSYTQGAGASQEGGKKLRQETVGRLWWSAKQKLPIEFTSSCRIHRFYNNRVILGEKYQYVSMTNPLHHFWSLLGGEEYLETEILAVFMTEWLDLATPILNVCVCVCIYIYV